jgi:uncharacterized protein
MTNNITMEDFNQIYEFVKINTSSFDESHNIDHAIAVYNNTLKIADTIKIQLEYNILTYAAMCHDVCDHKYENSIKPEVLINFITKQIGEDKCKRVMNIINNISFSKQIKGLRQQLPYPDNIYLDIVSDADRLEAIGQIGIDRCIAYTEATGGKVPEDVIKHCHEKLLLLKDQYIVTKKGKKLAEPLHEVIQDYVDFAI